MIGLRGEGMVGGRMMDGLVRVGELMDEKRLGGMISVFWRRFWMFWVYV